MKKKNIAGLIAIIAIVVAAMLAGCVEEETPTITPTPEQTPTPTSSPEPKYSHGDIVQEKYPEYPKSADLILDYSPDADNYKMTLIFEVNGVWLYRSEIEYLRSREIIEDDEIKVGHVDVSKVMSREEYWEGGGYQKAHATPTPTTPPFEKLSFFEEELVGKWSRYHAYDGSYMYFIFNSDRTGCYFEIHGSSRKKEKHYSYWKLHPVGNNAFLILHDTSTPNKLYGNDIYDFIEDAIFKGGYKNLKMTRSSTSRECKG
jgi:hypothetical protein